ncbi:MAG: polyribonucleotide nucleotidyltransferase [Candidatus Caenarcaniphilales bacterium]|nr:polyribonucleotide nucleotidyltransferase [Candidatus Caenarcaniphilales bacterium]
MHLSQDVINRSVKAVECCLTPEKKITLEVGRVAGEAKGSVLVKYEDTIILVTCCESKEPKQNVDFFPLTVDFEERLYAVGRIPGSYNRREGKANDKAILSSRLIDRPIRPLFPDGYYNDVQIVATVLSSDVVNPPDVLAIFGASAAIELAGLPFQGPIGGVRVALNKALGQFIINPTYEEIENSPLDLVVAGTEKAILMIEAGATFVKEEVILAGIAFAHDYIKMQVASQKELVNLLGVQKREFTTPSDDEALMGVISQIAKDKLTEAVEAKLTDKQVREAISDQAYKAVKEHFEALSDEDPLKEKAGLAGAYVKKLEKKLMRKQIMEKGERIDGRKCNEIRPIWSEAGFLPRAHGSAIFTRGSTQVLSAVTLGSGFDAKPMDGIWPEKEQTYFHNYNFPGFSVGEAKASRGPGRREIGHGALAERAIIPALPSKQEFPYVIRVVSDVLSSNGSTSMASTCGSTLALMDAGVPLKHPVAGIAMGLILDEGKCAILSDIQGVEDFLGDMDFKVTGSQDGVTAIQLDLKLPQGIGLPVLKVALDQALVGRQHILSKMLETLDQPRQELSKYAPRLLTMQVDVDSIGGIIGPGGKNIKKLIEESGVEKIDISDDGTVVIVGTQETAERAMASLGAITMKIIPGEEYPGVIIRKMPIGIFVEIGPGKVGLLKLGNGGGGDRRYGGRGGRNDRHGGGRYNNRDNRDDRHHQHEEQQAPVAVENHPSGVNPNDFELGQEVIAVVDAIDPRGRINLVTIRPIG